MPADAIRLLVPHDYTAWEPLWQGYQTFYHVDLGPEVTSLTWQRFHDPAEPMFALGAFDGETLVGFSHYLFHRTCWAIGPTCYLQDLFTAPAARGQGVGRALIEAVAAAARTAGAARLYWLTHESNTTAMRLYDRVAVRSGFVQYRHNLTP
ncbi:MAG TPA: GNAT family N-acetyltransferase [Roseiflexaceae bacterium]|nr:GNAT family N-acetyltransferase [Roseiflexaceae bacterium]HMP43131.1 GNAT family N-acetyltransferase [Roseiflexaceae bacterium]